MTRIASQEDYDCALYLAETLEVGLDGPDSVKVEQTVKRVTKLKHALQKCEGPNQHTRKYYAELLRIDRAFATGYWNETL